MAVKAVNGNVSDALPIVRLDHPDDDRLSEFWLADREALRSRGLFVAEGRLVVERVIAAPGLLVRSLLLSDAALRALAPTVASLPQEVPIYVAPAEAFAAITGFNIHRGCLALVERPLERRADALAARARLMVVLEHVANADNVGGVFRNAAAFGADAVLLSPAACDPLYRKAMRTSMGAALRVPFARIDPWPAGLSLLAACGLTVVALTPREGSETIDDFVARGRPGRVALLVGAEGAGLTPECEAFAERRVRIPIRADVDSLNLAVAAGIALSRLSAVALSDRTYAHYEGHPG